MSTLQSSEKLSPYHIVILVYMTQFGVIIFSLPQLLSKAFGTNGWVMNLIFAIIVIVNMLLIGAAYWMGKGKSIFVILERAMPRIMLYPLYLFLMFVWSVLGCLVAKEYVLIFQMIAFPTTHPMFFKIALDLLVFWLMIQGIYNISKSITMLFYLTIWMLPVVCFFYADFSWSRLTPFFFREGQPSPVEFVNIFASYLGYELILMVFPYTDKKSKLIKSSIIGSLLLAFIYTYLCIITFGFFSLRQLQRMAFPLLDLMAYIKFPFIERVENLFFGAFLFTTVATVVMYLWSAQETALQVFKRANVKLVAGVLVIFAYVIAFIPDTLSDVQHWLGLFAQLEIGIAFILPLLLVVVLAFTKNKKEAAS
ncbi:spore germination protein (amino acid permease) [Paenibacillus taihuensis]|uniref:Spore germination protein (Amino acid permease) n=1 Tax=Paenibacillus taihuensis TaxID=1156355 RepID=A0A3D9RSA6_9BACL|nr:GerAB/ArcD/ProY family transporter [Paenibacillus taihuensis]REE78921.1 spore germination protein (amino acid permease) [Paenibacillus taihuensis]